MPAYSHNVSLDLYEQIGFSRVSSSVKRLLVARWVNQGKGPMDVPSLSTSDQSRFMKITGELGFEVLQEVLLLADEAEERERREQREAAIQKAREQKYGGM